MLLFPCSHQFLLAVLHVLGSSGSDSLLESVSGISSALREANLFYSCKPLDGAEAFLPEIAPPFPLLQKLYLLWHWSLDTDTYCLLLYCSWQIGLSEYQRKAKDSLHKVLHLPAVFLDLCSYICSQVWAEKVWSSPVRRQQQQKLQALQSMGSWLCLLEAVRASFSPHPCGSPSFSLT